MECAEMEKELRENEINEINSVLKEYQDKKEAALAHLKDELRDKLKNAKEEDKEAIVAEYMKKMEEETERLEKEKQQKLKDVRKKREMYKRHKAEAAAAGITDVVDLDIPSEDQLEKDLLLLAKQQEKLIAELNRAMAEQDALNRDNWDEETRAAYEKEMLARVNELNQTYGTQGGEQAAQQANEHSQIIDGRRANLKDRMKERRERRKSRKGLDGELSGLEPGSEEEESAVAAAQSRDLADRLMEEQALLDVLSEVDAEH